MNPSITESQLFASFRLALLNVVDCEIVRGLDNLVAPPLNEYIIITPILSERQSTNETAYTEGFRHEAALYHYTIQIDCYGRNSGNNANVINLLFRGDYFNEKGITPLRASNPRQLMFEGNEHQMIERWTMDAVVSYNHEIALAQQSATNLSMDLLYQADN